jgi:hypothetical protein
MPMPKQSMTRRLLRGVLAVALSVGCVTAWAQAGGQRDSQGNSTPTQPSKPSSVAPAPADLEPGVNTSATPMSSDEAAPAPVPVPKSAPSASKPAPGVRSKATVPAGATSPPGVNADGATGAGTAVSGSANSTPAKAAGMATSAAPKSGAPGKAHDNLELDTTQITGNRELPKVLYIVPWKRSDLGDLVGKPVNSILDEVLQPVDRDVFKRQNRYYDALKPDNANPAPGTAASDTPEKH